MFYTGANDNKWKIRKNNVREKSNKKTYNTELSYYLDKDTTGF
jgi:hypothetical protein